MFDCILNIGKETKELQLERVPQIGEEILFEDTTTNYKVLRVIYSMPLNCYLIFLEEIDIVKEIIKNNF